MSNLPVSPVSNTKHPLRFYSVSLLSILKQEVERRLAAGGLIPGLECPSLLQ